MPIDLRRATSADIPSMEALYFPYSGRHINAARVGDALGEYPSVVAFEGQRLFGFSYCFRFAPDILELANIYIDSSRRQSGVGSLMLDFLISKLPDGVKAIIAVNSDLYPVNGEKRKPDSFYIRKNFQVLVCTPDSTVYWWQRP
jgi:GNAT superfamily N-acetyltransferase